MYVLLLLTSRVSEVTTGDLSVQSLLMMCTWLCAPRTTCFTVYCVCVIPWWFGLLLL